MLSTNIEQSERLLPSGECVDFSRYPHLHRFASEFTLGWGRFSNLGNTNLNVWNPIPPEETGAGIRFGRQGLTVTLNRTSGSITVVGNTSGGPLQIVAYTSSGEEVDRATITRATTPMTSTLNGENIRSLTMSESAESLLQSICIGAVDPGDVFDDAIRDGMNQDDAVRRHLEDPRGEAIRQQHRQEFIDYYEGRRVPQTGGGLGSGIGVDFNWPPDWACVARAIAIWIAVTICLYLLCQLLGITLIALGTEQAVGLIVTTFGVTAETALFMFWTIRLSGVMMGAFARCGVFGDV